MVFKKKNKAEMQYKYSVQHTKLIFSTVHNLVAFFYHLIVTPILQNYRVLECNKKRAVEIFS